MSRATALRSLLEAFEPHTDSQATFRQRMLTLTESAGCMGRDHFEPGHFTASSFVLSPDLDQILLIFHGKLNIWVQPGGHVDPDDENILAAARREVAEEVNLPEVELLHTGIFDVDIHDIPARKEDPKHQHFDVRFLFRAPHLDAEAGSDARAAQWVPLETVDALQSDESVLRAVRQIRALRAAGALGSY